MWRSAAVVYLIMMTIVLFMYARRDEELDAWIFAQAGLAAIVVGFGVMPLFTGVVEWRDASYPRNTKPLRYWASIVVTVFLGLALFLLGLGVIGQ